MTVLMNQLEQIIRKAAWSPSGDNSQPWTFEWDGQELQIMHDPHRGEHPLNPEGVASMLSLGCLLTAIDLAASDFQLSIQIKIEKMNLQSQSVWARVKFQSSQREKNILSDQLLNRTTDRRLYSGGELNFDFFKNSNLDLFTPARLHVLPKPNRRVIDYLVQAEQLLLDHAEILPSTMKWVRFTMNQARNSLDGMLWRNMEIKPWELPMVPVLRDVPNAVKILAPLIRPQNKIRVRQQLESASGLVCVSIPSQNINAFVDAGRLMMQAWLTLNHRGYGVQPFTIASTISFCARHGLIKLPQKWIEFFVEGENILREEFSISKETEPVWIIRTGQSTVLPDNARTLRKNVSNILKVKSV